MRKMCNLSEGIYRQGVLQGELRGVRKGEIQGAIKVYNNKMHLSPSDIIAKVMSDFDLEEKDATEYVNKTLGLQEE